MRIKSEVELTEEDIMQGISMFLTSQSVDLGTTDPVVVLSADKKGKGASVTATITLSSEKVSKLGNTSGELTTLDKPAVNKELFTKPTPKPAKELVEELEEEEAQAKITKAQDAADMVRTLEEDEPVEEEEEVLEEVVEEDEPVQEEEEEVIEEPVEEVVEEKPAKKPLFAKKTTTVSTGVSKDNLFGKKTKAE